MKTDIESACAKGTGSLQNPREAAWPGVISLVTVPFSCFVFVKLSWRPYPGGYGLKAWTQLLRILQWRISWE